jgi:hypothetical integral membrane protein (TIGR02206 family)
MADPTRYTLVQLTLIDLVCLALVLGFMAISWRIRGRGSAQLFAWTMALSGFASILYMDFWYLGIHEFDAAKSLPLFWCDLIGLLAPLALVARPRWMQTITYFFAPPVLIAFFTPVGAFRPDWLGFWFFWWSHSLIVGAWMYLVLIRVYRPTIRDLMIALMVGTAYVMIMLPVNWITGWNYGFIGKEGPPFFMGGWPWHVLAIQLLGMLLCVLLWWPLRQQKTRPPP